MKNTFMTVISFFAVIATVLAVIAGISFLTKPAADDHIHTYRTIGNTATCEQGGEKHEICTECGIKRTVQSSALGHDIEITDIPATCTTAGTYEESCRRCDYQKNENLPAFGHNYVYTDYTPATCTEPLIQRHVCSACSDESYNEYGAALGHAYSEGDPIPATCTDDSIRVDVCSRCSDEKQIVVAPPLGHDPVFDHYETANCTEGGTRVYLCSRCSLESIESFPWMEHTLVSHERKEATCTSYGHEAYVACTVCSYTTYQEIPPTPHQFNGYHCTSCGYLDPLTTLADTTWVVRKNFDTSSYSGPYYIDYTIEGVVEDADVFYIGWIFDYDVNTWIPSVGSIGYSEDGSIAYDSFIITIHGGANAEDDALKAWFRANGELKATIS